MAGSTGSPFLSFIYSEDCPSHWVLGRIPLASLASGISRFWFSSPSFSRKSRQYLACSLAVWAVTMRNQISIFNIPRECSNYQAIKKQINRSSSNPLIFLRKEWSTFPVELTCRDLLCTFCMFRRHFMVWLPDFHDTYFRFIGDCVKFGLSSSFPIGSLYNVLLSALNVRNPILTTQLSPCLVKRSWPPCLDCEFYF